MMTGFAALFRVSEKIIRLKISHPDSILFIALSGIGDVCYSLSVLDKLKKERNKKVVLLTSEYTSYLGGCYASVDETVVLTPEEECAFRRVFNKADGIFVYNKISLKTGIFNCFPLTEKSYNKLKKENKSYIRILSEAVGKKDTKPAYPVVKSEIAAKVFFENPEKTVLINPGSNSLSFDNNDIFIKITDALISKGYTVYTNVVGDQKALPHTVQLRCSIEELYALSKEVKLFVSIRSGIVDFCISSGGSFLVLYDDSWNGDFKRAYTLHSWKTDSLIYELDYRDTDEILKTIDIHCQVN